MKRDASSSSVHRSDSSTPPLPAATRLRLQAHTPPPATPGAPPTFAAGTGSGQTSRPRRSPSRKADAGAHDGGGAAAGAGFCVDRMFAATAAGLWELTATTLRTLVGFARRQTARAFAIGCDVRAHDAACSALLLLAVHDRANIRRQREGPAVNVSRRGVKAAKETSSLLS